jgi:hypothetical protein
VKLHPCWWCGSEVEVCVREPTSYQWVYCLTCAQRGPTHHSAEGAGDAWNKGPKMFFSQAVELPSKIQLIQQLIEMIKDLP